MYSSLIFSVFTELCNHHHYLVSGHFIIPPDNPTPISNHSSSSLPQPLVNTNLLSVSMDLPIMDISYE